MANEKIDAVFMEVPVEQLPVVMTAFFRNKKKAPAADAVPPIQPSKRQLIDNNDKAAQAKKLNFLGHCLSEYIRRTQCHFNVHITEELLLQRAIEFRDLIGIDGFTPDKSWINQFLAAYNATLSNRQIKITRSSPWSMDLRHIMSYCGRYISMACNLLPRSPEPATPSDQRAVDRPLCRGKTLMITSWENQANSEEVRKITFLEKCLYEYIQRSQVHHKGLLNIGNLRSVAISLRDILKIDSFYPDKTWFDHFKNHYNFTFSVGVPITQRQVPVSLDLRDIINYCCQHDQRINLALKELMESKSTTESPTTPTENLQPEVEDDDDCVVIETPTELIVIEDEDKNNASGIGDLENIVSYCVRHSAMASHQGTSVELKSEDKNNASGLIQTPIKRKMDDNSEHSFSKIGKVHHSPQQQQPFNDNDTETAPPPNRGHYSEASNETRGCVKSFKDALRQLQSLENFALMEENFRATNLLSQLRQIFETGKGAEEMGSSIK